MLGESMATVTVGDGDFAVTLRVACTQGNGLCAFFFGGQRPHVGGVAVAVPRHSDSAHRLTTDISQICVPGHKDVILASRLADLLARRTAQVVSVSVGIHTDDVVADEIVQLQENAEKAAMLWLESQAVDRHIDQEQDS
jgi:hypothetical protein